MTFSMRKTFLVIILGFAGFCSSVAQEAFLSLGAAYGAGVRGVIHPMFEQSSIVGNNITVTAKKLNLGSGFNYRADFRYYFDEYFGIGVQGTLMRGDWQYFSSDRKIVFVQHTTQGVRSNGFALAAAFHARLGENSVIPYFSLFPGFYAGTLDLVDTVSYSEQVKTSVWKYTSLNSFFLSAAAGIDISINDELKIFLEAEAQNITVAPKRANLLFLNGSDELQDVPMSEKVIVFMDKITTDYTQVPDETQPKRELKPYFPLDNYQIRIGIRILLTD